MYAFLRRKREWEYWHEQHRLELQQLILRAAKDFAVRAITLISFLLFLFYKSSGWLKRFLLNAIAFVLYNPRPCRQVAPGKFEELHELPPPVPIFKR